MKLLYTLDILCNYDIDLKYIVYFYIKSTEYIRYVYVIIIYNGQILLYPKLYDLDLLWYSPV